MGMDHTDEQDEQIERMQNMMNPETLKMMKNIDPNNFYRSNNNKKR